MKLRPFNDNDVLTLDELWQKYWSEHSLPNRNSMIIDAVVEHDNRVLAYGQVRCFAEAMLFLDPTLPRGIKADALRLLMSEAFRGCEKSGIEDLYAFIKDPKFSKVMQKHYDFKSIPQPGELLLRKV